MGLEIIPVAIISFVIILLFFGTMTYNVIHTNSVMLDSIKGKNKTNFNISSEKIIISNKSFDSINISIKPIRNKFISKEAYFFFDSKLLSINCSPEYAIKPIQLNCTNYLSVSPGKHSIRVCFNDLCKNSSLIKYFLVFDKIKPVSGSFFNGIILTDNELNSLKYLDNNYFILNKTNVSLLMNSTKFSVDYYINSSINITLSGILQTDGFILEIYNNNSLVFEKAYDSSTTTIYENITLNLNKTIEIKLLNNQTKDIYIDFISIDANYGTLFN